MGKRKLTWRASPGESDSAALEYESGGGCEACLAARRGSPPTSLAALRSRCHRLGGEIAAVVREIDHLRADATGSATAEEAPNELAQRIGAVADFLRKRLTGDYSVDEFGFDPQFNNAVVLPMLRVFFENWFRVEVSGVENLPPKAPPSSSPTTRARCRSTG